MHLVALVLDKNDQSVGGEAAWRADFGSSSVCCEIIDLGSKFSRNMHFRVCSSRSVYRITAHMLGR
jgi:hypothetical protein